MSLAPLYLRLLEDLTPSHVYDQDFGLGMLGDDMVIPRSILPLGRRPDVSFYRRPYHQGPGSSNVASNKDEFKINLAVQHFKPNEINVKVVDRTIVIDGKHEERQDEHGYISREFKRRYMIPDDVDPATVTSTLSSDGVLTVAAPKMKAIGAGKERSVPIAQTNKPAITNDRKNGTTEELQKMEQ